MTVAEIEKLFGKRQGVVSEPAPVARPRYVYVPLAAHVDENEGRCCASAARIPCYCRVSWKCSTHGTTCVGVH